MSDGDSKNTSRTDWARIDAMSDDEIDFSDIPELTDEFFKRAQWRGPSSVEITMRIDARLLAWFQLRGDDWQDRIQDALREYVKNHRDEKRASA